MQACSRTLENKSYSMYPRFFLANGLGCDSILHILIDGEDGEEIGQIKIGKDSSVVTAPPLRTQAISAGVAL